MRELNSMPSGNLFLLEGYLESSCWGTFSIAFLKHISTAHLKLPVELKLHLTVKLFCYGCHNTIVKILIKDNGSGKLEAIESAVKYDC